MFNDLLEEVVVYVAGKQAEPIAELLNKNKPVNEFLIAKKLDLTINQTRNILYRISDKGLVLSERKKDKKKGWYTYFWKINVLKTLEFLKNLLLNQKDKFIEQLKKRESNQFYICKTCNIEMTEEDALLQNFTCDECGEVFSVKDNSKLIKEFKKNIKKIEEKLEVVNEEIEKEEAKLEKLKERKLKKISEEKAEKRKAARKKTAKKKAAKKKATKKKKAVKKKAVKKKPIKKKATKKKKKIAKKKTSKKKSKK